MIELRNVSFSYNADSADAIAALREINLTIPPGQLVAIIGHNGSGKSTLARLLVALLVPTSGTIHVDDLEASPTTLWEIRRRVGIVFQRPDDQLVANTVIDDVAFGLENIGIPPTRIEQQAREALAALDLAALADAQISELSGGEKQRVAIAGVLAMQPQYVILDEPTTMLTPRLARQLIDLAARLRAERGVTVIHITHFMYEVTAFDRVIVMDGGRVVMDGPPRAIFARISELQAIGLDVPLATQISARLQQHGYAIPQAVLHANELAAVLATFPPPQAEPGPALLPAVVTETQLQPAVQPLIATRDLHFTYLAGTPLARIALRGVTCAVYAGEMLALLGGSQAGKSTLIEFFNGLRTPAPQRVFFDGADIGATGYDLNALRFQVGIVFQQPEAQLFEDTVGRDVSFTPRMRKLPPADSRAIVQRVLTDVGLDYETFRLRYVYALSGGQKRRVAIAGVLAMEPRVLILDEPTAGLDPRGRADLIALIHDLRKRLQITVVLVGNTLDTLAQEADRILVMQAGQVALEGTPRALLRQGKRLKELGLELSEPAELALALQPNLPNLRTDMLSAEELEQELLTLLGGP